MSRATDPATSGARPLLTVEELAADRGVKAASLRTAVWRAVRRAKETGTWTSSTPRPDVSGRGRPLGWDPTRPDVIAYRFSGGPTYPQLENREWLQERWPGKSAQAIAEEVGCTKAWVYVALDRASLNPAGDTGALGDVSLAELEGLRVEHGSWEAVAAHLGRSRDTVYRALRRKRAAAGIDPDGDPVGEPVGRP